MNATLLRAVFNDEVNLLVELLGRDNSKTIHQRNIIKMLAAELFKIKNNLLNDIMAQLICKRISAGYNLHSQTGFSLLQVKPVNCSLKALQHFSLKIQNILEHFKNSQKIQVMDSSKMTLQNL